MTTTTWGPVTIPANTPTGSPAITVAPTDTAIAATADFSALPVGVTRTVLVQYRKTATSPWIDYGSVNGTTLGGPDLTRQGTVTEWGISVNPLPDPGLSGRQVRFVGTIGSAATLSGHLTTS